MQGLGGEWSHPHRHLPKLVVMTSRAGALSVSGTGAAKPPGGARAPVVPPPRQATVAPVVPLPAQATSPAAPTGPSPDAAMSVSTLTTEQLNRAVRQ